MRDANTVMRDMFDNYPPTPKEKRDARLAARDRYMPVIRRILGMEPESKNENRRTS